MDLFTASIVEYKGAYYLHYGNNTYNRARLLKADGRKFSGTPIPDKLNVVKQLKFILSHGGHRYVMTRQGIISLTSGNKITNHVIYDIMINMYSHIEEFKSILKDYIR